MEDRRLGRTGVEVGQIGRGAMMSGGELEAQGHPDALQHVREVLCDDGHTRRNSPANQETKT